MFKIKSSMVGSTTAIAFLLCASVAFSAATKPATTPYVSKSLGIALDVPQAVYPESKSEPAQTVKILESGNSIFLSASGEKISGMDLKNKFAPSGTIQISVVNDVAPEHIEKLIKTMIDDSCVVYSLKPAVNGLSLVEFGPANKANANDVSDACVMGRPVEIKYSGLKKKLVKIEVGAQDCIFFNGPGVVDGDCVLDEGILASVRVY